MNKFEAGATPGMLEDPFHTGVAERKEAKRMAESYTQKIKDITKNYRDAKKKMIAEAKTVFIEVTKEIFEQFPAVESFGWTQYTPYWCDGEACEFGVNHNGIYINGQNEDMEDDDGKYPEFTEELSKAEKAIDKFVASIDEEMLQEWFGDHVHVTIYRNGKAKTEEYEHE
jgi:hypothetical protein